MPECEEDPDCRDCPGCDKHTHAFLCVECQGKVAQNVLGYARQLAQYLDDCIEHGTKPRPAALQNYVNAKNLLILEAQNLRRPKC